MLHKYININKSTPASSRTHLHAPKAINSARGAAMVMVVIIIFTLLSIVGLVIDLARLETVIRRLQNVADGASLAGANLIEASIKLDSSMLEDKQTEINNWANVKKAVLLHLKNANIPDLHDSVNTMLADTTLRYNTGMHTTGDCPGYDKDTVEAGNLKVVVRRKIFCLLPSLAGDTIPRRKVIDIESEQVTRYCRANAVSVELQLSDIKFFFARIMGFFSGQVQVRASSFNRERLPKVVGSCPNSDASHPDCQPFCNAIDCRVLGISPLIPDPTVPDGYNIDCAEPDHPSNCITP